MTKENKTTIYQRIHKVMQDVSYIQKEDKKVNNQYTFVSHDAVTRKIRAAMVEHGIITAWNVDKCEVTKQRAIKWDNYKKANIEYDIYIANATLSARFINADNKDDFIDTAGWMGTGIDQGDKAVGKAYSYAKKYCLLNNFMLETGDDPERDTEVYEIIEQREAPNPDLIDVMKICDYIEKIPDAETYKQWSSEQSDFIQYNADKKQKAEIGAAIKEAKERLGIENASN